MSNVSPSAIKSKKDERELNKNLLNMVRTTMRNNIELTHIADNKANVLLTLNAVMITFLVPFAIPNLDILRPFYLQFPLAVLIISSFTTIYICALVLKPGKFYHNQKEMEQGIDHSPFFFGNFFNMTKEEYLEYFTKAVKDQSKFEKFIASDLHYLGNRLGRKMGLIRLAINIFLTGLFLAIVFATALLIIFSK